MSASDLDTRWIDETEQELETASPTNHVRSPQTTITTTFVYMNANDSIDKVITEIHEIAPPTKTTTTTTTIPTIPYEQILQIIQRKKTTPAAKYKLIEILLYVVDLEPSQIKQYANSPDYCEISASFVKVCSSYSEIQIPETLSIFHKVNALYFVFKEKQKMVPRSILKNTTPNPDENTEDLPEDPKKKTRRHQNTRAHTKRVLFR